MLSVACGVCRACGLSVKTRQRGVVLTRGPLGSSTLRLAEHEACVGDATTVRVEGPEHFSLKSTESLHLLTNEEIGGDGSLISKAGRNRLAFRFSSHTYKVPDAHDTQQSDDVLCCSLAGVWQ